MVSKHIYHALSHLLKDIRNNLKKTGFIFFFLYNQLVIFSRVFRLNCQNAVRMAHKLSLKHVQRAPFANVNVKLAAQVLSHTVANGDSTLVHIKVLPADTLHTVHFMKT